MKKQANILFICTDQQTADSIITPEIIEQLPNLNYLRQHGVTFQNAVCCSPQCTPSRGGIITGLYPHRTGVITNLGAGCTKASFQESIELSQSFKTAGEYLQDAGYQTAYFGKWHLGVESWGKGFDRYASGNFPCTEEVYEQYTPGNGSYDPVVERLSCEFIAEKHVRPFALFAEFINPHDCYYVPGINSEGDELYGDVELELDSLELRKNCGKHPLKETFMRDDQGYAYYGQSDEHWLKYRAFYRYMLALIDAHVGKLIETLRQNGQLKNTVIVFTSDHGDMETAHEMIYKGPFMYRELVNVPLIVSFPEQDFSPRISSAMINNIDLLPTLSDFAGINIDSQVDGKSFKTVIENKTDEHREYVVSEYYCKQKWCNPCRMYSTKLYKYVRYRNEYEELYDLQNDIGEEQNLAAKKQFADIKAELSNGLDKWMTDTDDSFDRYPVSDISGKLLTV